MRFFPLLFTALFIALTPVAAHAQQGTVEKRTIQSANFAHSRIGISPERRIQVYLPAGYAEGEKSYPVIYYLHNFFEDEASFFEGRNGKALFDRAIENGAMPPAIIVTADFNTPLGGSLYANSPVTGNWEDFMVRELVPYIDANFRTIRSRDSRGIFGYFIGGNGAIRFASRYPGTFGSVYAMHPVGTGFGNILMQSRPDWEKLENAQSMADLRGDGLSEIFTAIYQAFLPDTDNAPLYFDPPGRRENGELVLDTALVEKVQAGFFLEKQVPQYAENMKRLNGFKFDWGRHDGNQDHVYSNQFYSRKLNEFGVPHEAEEYNGDGTSNVFGPDGRIESDVIPFFRAHLHIGETAGQQTSQGN